MKCPCCKHEATSENFSNAIVKVLGEQLPLRGDLCFEYTDAVICPNCGIVFMEKK